MKTEVRRQKATVFSLVELLVVISIILVLVGIIVGVAKYAQTKAATLRAQAEIATIEAALEHYKSDNGVYPTTPVGRPTTAAVSPYGNSSLLYSALVGGPGFPKTYMTFKANQIQAINSTTTNVVDPFGVPYNYYNPATQPQNDQSNSVTFDLWSYGPDGQNGTADDIVNWRQ